jgi:shikimate kinase
MHLGRIASKRAHQFDYIWHFSEDHAIQGMSVCDMQFPAQAAVDRRWKENMPQAEPTAPKLLRPVVLVGMMGAGKTAVGSQMARMLAVPFLDSDEEIERAANRSVAEIFARDGEPFFRARESEVLARLLSGEPSVLSTGGGAFMAEGNRTMIADRGVSVWLRADLELLWNRVRHKSTRPLLRTADPRGTLGALLATREPIYGLAQVTVDAEPELSVENMAQKVISALHERPGMFG